MLCVRAVTVCCLFITLGTVTLTGVVVAADPDLTAGADVAAGLNTREAEQKLLQSLNKKIKVNWPNVPLTFPLKLIAREAGVPLWIDQDAGGASGVDPEYRVTLKRGESTMWQALDFLLTPLQMTWEATDGVLVVLPTMKSQQRLITRTYDISAIVKELDPQLEGQPRGRFPRREQRGREPDLPRNVVDLGTFENQGFPLAGIERPPRRADFQSVPRRGRIGNPSYDPPINVEGIPYVLAQFGGAGGGIAAPPPENRQLQIPSIGDQVERGNFGWRIGESRSRAEIAIIELLQQGPWNWGDVNSNGGSMAVVSGRLIVRQDYQTQLQIQALLNALDTIFVRGTKVKSLQVRRPGYPHDEDAVILQRLNVPTTIDVADEPLMEILQSLTQSAGIRHWLDVNALTDEGHATDEPMTLSHTDVPLSVILKHLLGPIGLVAVIHEGTLVVTTQAKATETDSQSTAIYSLADLAGNNPEEIVSVIEQSTGQMWEHIDGDGGTNSLLGPRWLVVWQSPRAHAEIANLLEILRRTPKGDPHAPDLAQRIYSVADATAVADLLQSLPELVPHWDRQRGSIHRLGQSLVIQQLPVVHERVEEIITALNSARDSLNPEVPAAIPAKLVEDQGAP